MGIDTYNNKEISFQEVQLREYFRLAIPRLLDYIQENSITHILLLEKTGRVFKAPLVRLFADFGIDVKVGSYAPDYFEVGEGIFQRKKQNKKLDFLPDVGDQESKILILDDFSNSGLSLVKASKGLQSLGYQRDTIFTQAFSGFSEALLDVEEHDALNIALLNPDSMYCKNRVFLQDNVLTGRRHAVLNKRHPVAYKEVVRGLMRLILDSVDYYLTYESSQPKKDIADYVESQGFRVPKRFNNLEEALSQGQDFIMRSEHPQDYDGISGLFESYVFYASELDISPEEVLSEQQGIIGLDKVQEYCQFTGKDYDTFTSKCSFEYWEYVEGENITVVRDDVVDGRYHIFHNDKSGSDYICYDEEEITQGSVPEQIGNEVLKSIISQYEGIAKLSRFDPQQCPNIEFQYGDDGNIYFLQYKRGHQIQSENWVLDRELEEGEIEVDFVRGATVQGGEVFTIFHRPGVLFQCSQDNSNFYEGALAGYYTKDELVIQEKTDRSYTGLDFHGAVAHISQSKICIHVQSFIDKLLDRMQVEFYLDAYENTDLQEVGIQVFVESDGTRAIIKLIDSPELLKKRAEDIGYPQRNISYYDTIE